MSYLKVLRTETGTRRGNVRDDAPARFNGRPGFLLEPDAAECYPFGLSLLSEPQRSAQLPTGPLFYQADERDETLTELAVALVAPLREHLVAVESLAIVAAHTCLSEDVSTCLTSRVIDVLRLSAMQSLSVLGELGSAWASALECANALRLGEGAAQTTLLLALEKWQAPFQRQFGDLFALSDGLAAVLLSDKRPVGPCIAVRSWASCASSIDAAWLSAPVPVDVAHWARAAETGLGHMPALQDDALVLGPTLGVLAQDLRAVAPRLAALIERQHALPTLAGHFGAADPFVRIGALLATDAQRLDGKALLVWSVGPGGDVSVLNGVIMA